MRAWLERDTSFIAVNGQPSVLVDICLQRGIESHRLLSGTGLFLEHVLSNSATMAPHQYLTLINNAQRLLKSDDSAFLLGQRLLPSTQGGASLALKLANNLQQALEALVTGRALLSPLLAPRLVPDDQHAYLYWQDNFGAAEAYPFLLAASMVSVVALSRRQSNERLPWRFYFRQATPSFLEQYWVHLGQDLHFNQPFDVMCIPREYLSKNWQQSSASAQQVAFVQTHQQLQELPAEKSLLEAVATRLLQSVEAQPSLEALADYLTISPATLKRKLRKHNTHFQQQLDTARLQHALFLLSHLGLSCEQVASRLRFHDTASFRRSFKRWTGVNPSTALNNLAIFL